MKIQFKAILITLSFFLFSNSLLAISPFKDLQEDDYAYLAITSLFEGGVIDGYPDGSFSPELKINRAEFLKMVLEAAKKYEKIDNEITGANCFPDVKDEWFAKYVCTAKELEIISGYPNGNFYPEKEVNFVEASKIVLNAFDAEISMENAENWYQPYVDYLAKYNNIPNTIVGFDNPITRADMACILTSSQYQGAGFHGCGSSLTYKKIQGVSSIQGEKTKLDDMVDANFAFYKVDENLYIIDNLGNKLLLEEADPNSFQHLTGIYFKDNNNLFVLYLRNKDIDKVAQYMKILDSSDMDLSKLNKVDFYSEYYWFLKDEKSLYIGCSNNNPYSLQSIEDFDSENFHFIKETEDVAFFSDNKSVYQLGVYDCRIEKLDNIDPSTFQILTAEYSKDKNGVYFTGFYKLLETIRESNYLTKNYYFAPVDGVTDIESFAPAYHTEGIQSEYFQDKFNVYVPEGVKMKIFKTLDQDVSKPSTLTTYKLHGAGLVFMANKLGIITEDENTFQKYIYIDDQKYPFKGEHPNFLASKNHWILSSNEYGYSDVDSYILVNGTEYGPYDTIYPTALSDNKWGYCYEIDNEIYYNINGKEYGPYKDFAYRDLMMSDNYYAFTFEKDGTEDTYLNINGEEYGPYDNFENLQVTEDGWAFSYGEGHYNINGKEYGPYDYFESDYYGPLNTVEMKGDNWGILYSKDDQAYVKIKNKEFGPYEEVDNLKVTENGWVFRYNYEYLNINGKEYGPYNLESSWDDYSDDDFGSISMQSKDNWGFVFSNPDGTFVNINETIHGPYDSAEVLVTEDDWAIKINNSDGRYLNISGVLYGPYEYDYVAFLASELNLNGKGFAFTFYENGELYFNVNGEKMGPFDPWEYSKLYYSDNNFIFIYNDNYLKTNNPSLLKNIKSQQIQLLDPSLNIPIPEPEGLGG